jgi:hypothetical protein
MARNQYRSAIKFGHVLYRSTQNHVADTLQDVRTARFRPCFLPVIATFPAIIAALILVAYSLRVLRVYRPIWTKPFVQEKREKANELNPESGQQPLTATLGLLAIAAIGLALQGVTVFFPSRQLMAIYPLIAWVWTSSFLKAQNEC